MSALGKVLTPVRTIFLVGFGDGFLAPTSAQCSCEVDSFGPATWHHARSGLSGRFDPIELGVFEAKLTAVDGE